MFCIRFIIISLRVLISFLLFWPIISAVVEAQHAPYRGCRGYRAGLDAGHHACPRTSSFDVEAWSVIPLYCSKEDD